MSYDTNNPIGSTDPRDLYDNAENLDQAMNSTDSSWTDRFGRARKTFKAAEDALDVAEQHWGTRFSQFLVSSGYESIGDYGSAVVITEYNQIVRKGDAWFRLKPSVSIPYTASGEWGDDASDFIGVHDATIRQELSDSSTGGELVRVDTRSGDESLGRAIRRVDNIYMDASELKLDPNVNLGDIVLLMDLYNKEDGYGAYYKIVPAGTGDTKEYVYFDLSASGLQAEKISGRRSVMNNYGDGSNKSLVDLANFPDARRRAHVIHHYNDDDMVVWDNVGEDNVMLSLRNAANSNRRFDKPDGFYGTGNFLRCTNRMPYQGGLGSFYIFEILYDGELRWPNQGDHNKAVELTNGQLTHNNDYSFRLKTEVSNAKLLEITESEGVPAFQFSCPSGTLARLDAPSSMTSGLYICAEAGAIELNANGPIRIVSELDDGYFLKTRHGFGSIGRFLTDQDDQPTSPSSPGRRGDFYASADGEYVYFCYAPDSWSRIKSDNVW